VEQLEFSAFAAPNIQQRFVRRRPVHRLTGNGALRRADVSR
jgi:hypothetical protein